jgi:hypothetical protein
LSARAVPLNDGQHRRATLRSWSETVRGRSPQADSLTLRSSKAAPRTNAARRH